MSYKILKLMCAYVCDLVLEIDYDSFIIIRIRIQLLSPETLRKGNINKLLNGG